MESGTRHRFLPGSGTAGPHPRDRHDGDRRGRRLHRQVDAPRRITVGPDSASAACRAPPAMASAARFRRWLDADLLLHWIDPAHFAGGHIDLQPNASASACADGRKPALHVCGAGRSRRHRDRPPRPWRAPRGSTPSKTGRRRPHQRDRLRRRRAPARRAHGAGSSASTAVAGAGGRRRRLRAWLPRARRSAMRWCARGSSA